MAVEQINIEDFLEKAAKYPLFDVRSPGEFAHGHIPGAVSLPLFSDEERKIIGTKYKQESRQAAVDAGLGYFSRRMLEIPKEVAVMETANGADEEKTSAGPIGKTFLVHCWRGGMRSGAVAWLLNLYGYKIFVLRGGYKSYRRWCLKQFEKPRELKILGGYTGSGKTPLLQTMVSEGCRVIDLESLANHKGSAFGALGEMPQPSQEMFENLLAMDLWQQEKSEKAGPVWAEDESRNIGKLMIPPALWKSMRESKLYFLEIPFEERLKNIVNQYGAFDIPALQEDICKIQKRLGGLKTKNCIKFLHEGDIAACFEILLHYYDGLYARSLRKRQEEISRIHTIACDLVCSENARKLIEYSPATHSIS